MLATIVKYWPAVVAGLYVLYLLAAGQTGELPGAISAFLAAAGLSQSVAAAHAKASAANAKIDSLKS